ncbi:MAG TPA: UDP-N-acetylglucosamine 2-epimerase (non-hydrolyzing) [Dissulfurispiraceae bacterium]|nr:UDP-N-acetylglucosamine 2-epimerase (non-hydrolyzing) [Dissulfurispiraceae bacterium]
MPKVAVVVGTRPEVIKMAPVIMELQRRSAFECVVISSGQHETMAQQAFDIFGLRPDVNLSVMRPGQGLPSLTSILLNSVTDALGEVQPDVVLVQGDTTTVLAASLAAFYRRIPIGHVEAGLRTHNLMAPWPEEMNRRVTDTMCRWCFAPTSRARRNLFHEGVPETNVVITGNTVIDALLWMRDQLNGDPPQLPSALEHFLDGHRMILVTGHRRESFGRPFERICAAIVDVVNRFPDIRVVYPVHLNPNVREPVGRLLQNSDRISLIDPVDYKTFVWLMDRSSFVLTDSGGVQEEAPSLGKPVLVMRETTERPEGIEAGTVRLVGTDVSRIVYECSVLLTDAAAYRDRCCIANPYGDGAASKRIADVLAGLPAE